VDAVNASSALARIGAVGVVPVLTVDKPERAAAVARALAAGGLPCVEVTFRTAAALDAVRLLAQTAPHLLVGAGTVFTVAQAASAVAAGAHFVVAPGLDDAIVEWGRTNDVLVLPGVMTPTEMMRAVAAGALAAKLFPAQIAGGVDLLDAVRPVFPSLRFVPTGGVTADRLAEYLSRPNVVACGGSWMVARTDVESGAFDRIEALARDAAELVRAARGTPDGP
jgi:2-dehydro-3-deoxyphosphogluconate aldolase/(4S)-4-hydroxy-2-oxoglutarate aldolase